MNPLELQEYFQSTIEWLISADQEEVTSYVHELRQNNPLLTRKQLAEKIISKQSVNSGLMGAVTGLGGIVTLPVTLPIDLAKVFKIQAFTICCISEIYGYGFSGTDLKTDIILLSSNSSVREIKKFVLEEAKKVASKHGLETLNQFTKAATRKTAKAAPKYIAKTAITVGDKAICNYALRKVPTLLRPILWKLGGKKLAEKSIQKMASKSIPVIGAFVGGGLDWMIIQGVGKLAIEYYEKNIPQWLDDIFVNCD